MKSTTYFAVFEKSQNGYSVYFPDLPGCISVGSDIKNAKKMAEEALGLHLWGMEKDNEEIPTPTDPPFEDMGNDDFIVPITVYMELVKNEMQNRAVKKTLTIPFWLNDIAEQNHVNFSQVLQTALKEYLNV